MIDPSPQSEVQYLQRVIQIDSKQIKTVKH